MRGSRRPAIPGLALLGIAASLAGCGHRAPHHAPASGTSLANANAAGAKVFAEAGCGGCHTLAAAHSEGAIGPNLDQAGPSKERVVELVTNGKGVMPSFKGQLTPRQIEDVAEFVATSSAAG